MSNKAKFKAGKTYELTLTVIVSVTPEHDCDEEDLAELAEDVIGVGEFDIDHVDYNSSEPEDEDEDADETAAEKHDANRVWDGLRNGLSRSKYPDLSPNQVQFITDALSCNLEVVAYSGRGMYGTHCPSVRVDHASELRTTVRYQQDSMGLGMVFYAQH